MRNDLSVNIPCKTCGQKATNVVPLEKDKGFEYYCDRHLGGNDITTLKELANKGRSSVRR